MEEFQIKHYEVQDEYRFGDPGYGDHSAGCHRQNRSLCLQLYNWHSILVG